MKKGRKKHLVLIPCVMLLSCLCWGCSNAETVVPVNSGSQQTGEQEEQDTDNGAAEGGNVNDTAKENSDGSKDTGEGHAETEQEGADGNHVEADENGVSGNSLQTETGDTSGEAVEEPEIQRRAPVKVKGIYVSGPVAGIARMDELIDLVDQTELNAMVIDIKNDDGKVTYDMQSEQVLEIEAGVGYIPDIAALVSKCKEKNIYLIARIVAFRDPYLAEKKPEWAVHTKDGGIFRDKSGLAWVNPYRREVWDYLVEIAGQAAAAGFDEVQFDYIRFSTDIKADAVDYGPESERVGKIEIITEFTEYLYEQLTPLGVYVAADVFGTVIENEIDQEIVGQDYVKMAEHLDYICPMIYPSHYRNGSYGISVPDADPYRTIYGACCASVQELSVLPEEKRAHVRAWLQSFTASWVPGHISYGPQQIREQIKGAYDAGYEEWILWNAAVKYQRNALLTEEEAEAERLQWETEKQEAAGKQSQDTSQGVNPKQEEGGKPEQPSGNTGTEQPPEGAGQVEQPQQPAESTEQETPSESTGPVPLPEASTEQ